MTNDLKEILESYLRRFTIDYNKTNNINSHVYLSMATKPQEYEVCNRTSEELLSNINKSIIILQYIKSINITEYTHRTLRFVEIPLKTNSTDTIATYPQTNFQAALIFCNFFKKKSELENLKPYSSMDFKELYNIISSENLEYIIISETYINKFWLLNSKFIFSDYCMNFMKLNVLNTV